PPANASSTIIIRGRSDLALELPIRSTPRPCSAPAQALFMDRPPTTPFFPIAFRTSTTSALQDTGWRRALYPTATRMLPATGLAIPRFFGRTLALTIRRKSLLG